MAEDRTQLQEPVGNRNYTNAAVVIIGAGISGICVAIDQLKKTNRNFVILEKGTGIGGTWRDNKYPGCCCDVWSHLYSYSFEPNPSWTREYGGQEEILQYLIGVAHKYELYRYIRFNTSVDSARWDDTTNKWNTTVSVLGGKDAEYGGDTYTMTSDFLVSAVGQLNLPKFPDIAGLHEFEGRLMHSARWDWSYSLRGKKVAIIGNGATAVQIIPAIAGKVDHLTVFQRTPNWALSRGDSPIPAWKRLLFQYIPFIRERKRAKMMDFREALFGAIVDPTSPGSDQLEDLSRQHLRTQLPNRPDLWDKLQPKYSLGCKRVLLTDDYFPVFLRDNVKLKTGRIDKITAKGIVVDGQEEAFDLIITATGFRAVEFLHPMEITGSSGRTLSSVWKDGGHALYGVTVEGFPNFGMLYGPNTNLAHNSLILMVEAQSKYITALADKALTARSLHGSLTISPKPVRVREFNEQLQSSLSKTSFADPNCDSWFKLKESGKITNNWSDTVVAYQKILSRVDWLDYDVVGTGADEIKRSNVTMVGRVVEESIVSDTTIGLTILSTVTVLGAFLYQNTGRLSSLR
ncbi:cyclohexanone monooxygenase [Cadophora sp. MPI-SDFR-AT-0126]|nr:cyclohexanone monooxygenase [Leotiomycetes sp. MPI-SDFR-AT-0126]